MPIDQASIAALVHRYESLTDAQRRSMSEADTRAVFIEPLLQALGWDTSDPQQVRRESGLATGRPDYTLIWRGVPRAYVEAKKLAEDLYRIEHAQQVISYAYNTGVDWAILTHFEGLVVFDAYEEAKDRLPRKVLDLRIESYTERFDELELLSPEGIESGRLLDRAYHTGTRPRTVPIEKRLYEQLRQWRERLLSQLAQVVSMKTEQEIRDGEEAVQRLFDRLLFLRNCEDRGIGRPAVREIYNSLRQDRRRVAVTQRLLKAFREADNVYDSDLFQMNAIIDVRLSTVGAILDDTLADIVLGLYQPPKSFAAYDFSLMDADVLGQVYEQYLGHVAQLRRLRAEEQQRLTKPGVQAEAISVTPHLERRKARGIYYTPKWVVDYIVKQTVGRFLEEHANRPDEIDKIAILDPACGSGSFLIRSYDTLLEHHALPMRGDVGHLDRAVRERILGHNIFGVDLDPQAVEIARLNLLLRMVHEPEQLPFLRDNIRVGNTLISGTEEDLQPYFGEGWRDKRPFDWEREFPNIMGRGGFDVIIGNPPYVRIQTLDRDEVHFYNDKYDAATGNYDIYCLFVERAVELLRPGGVLGFIVPNKFMRLNFGRGLRTLLGNRRALVKVVDFGSEQVFESGTNYTCLLFASRRDNLTAVYVPPAPHQTYAPGVLPAEGAAFEVLASTLASGPWIFVDRPLLHVLEKMREAAAQNLGDIASNVFQGLITGADAVYVLRDKGADSGELRTVLSTAEGRELELEASLLKPLVSGVHIGRYLARPTDRLLLFPYELSGGEARPIPEARFRNRFPRVWAYLGRHRGTLEARDRGKMRHALWYAFVRTQNLALHQYRKLAVPRLVQNLQAYYDSSGRFCLDNVDVGGVLLTDSAEDNYLSALAVLNSRAVNFSFRHTSVPFRGGFRSANRQFIEGLPVPCLERLRSLGAARSKALVSLAGRMLDLHQRLAAKGDVRDDERVQMERDIARTDREIDDLVYDLYGLTAEERDIIERETTATRGASALSAASDPVLAELWDNPDDAVYDKL